MVSGFRFLVLGFHSFRSVYCTVPVDFVLDKFPVHTIKCTQFFFVQCIFNLHEAPCLHVTLEGSVQQAFVVRIKIIKINVTG